MATDTLNIDQATAIAELTAEFNQALEAGDDMGITLEEFVRSGLRTAMRNGNCWTPVELPQSLSADIPDPVQVARFKAEYQLHADDIGELSVSEDEYVASRLKTLAMEKRADEDDEDDEG